MEINATLLGQMITFAIFVAFTMRFVWPMLQNKMQERAKFIADSLAAAELRNAQLAQSGLQAQEILRQATEKSNLLIEDAYKQSHEILDAARKQAFQDGNVIVENAKKQIDALLVQTKNDLQAEVADLVVLGVQKIINKSVSAQQHREIIDDLIQRLA